jgi:ABC-type polysaccharide/polyol phosphate transport system ATPase subunit
MKVIDVDDVSKRYLLGEDQPGRSLRESMTRGLRKLFRAEPRAARDEIWPLRNVTIEVSEGEALGVIGRNGAGKSTLLKILSRITEPTTGMSRTRGRVTALLEVGTGFHPELTGRENVYLNGAILGMSRRDTQRRFDEIVNFAGVERFIDTPVKRYSSGMYLRLAFSVAAHLEPDIMVVDEVLAVGDAEFQARSLGRMETAEREGRTVVFVSHNLDAISRLCSRAIWLEQGQIAAQGATRNVVEAYLSAQVQQAARTEAISDPHGSVALRDVRVVDPAGRPRRAVLGRGSLLCRASPAGPGCGGVYRHETGTRGDQRGVVRHGARAAERSGRIHRPTRHPSDPERRRLHRRGVDRYHVRDPGRPSHRGRVPAGRESGRPPEEGCDPRSSLDCHKGRPGQGGGCPSAIRYRGTIAACRKCP